MKEREDKVSIRPCARPGCEGQTDSGPFHFHFVVIFAGSPPDPDHDPADDGESAAFQSNTVGEAVIACTIPKALEETNERLGKVASMMREQLAIFELPPTCETDEVHLAILHGPTTDDEDLIGDDVAIHQPINQCVVHEGHVLVLQGCLHCGADIGLVVNGVLEYGTDDGEIQNIEDARRFLDIVAVNTEGKPIPPEIMAVLRDALPGLFNEQD